MRKALAAVASVILVIGLVSCGGGGGGGGGGGVTVTVPTLTTQTISSKTTTTVSGNGTIDTSGGGAIATRGFQYGLTQDPTWTVSEDGSFDVGAFTLPISGLTSYTTYYVRAFAVNSAGAGYGSWSSFTTNFGTGTGIALKENVKVFTDAETANLSSTDGSTYVYTTAPAKPSTPESEGALRKISGIATGDVILSQSGDGYAIRVLNVVADGDSTTFHAEPVSLEDVIQEGIVDSGVMVLTQKGAIQKASLNELGDPSLLKLAFSKEVELDGVTINVDGSVSAETQIKVDWGLLSGVKTIDMYVDLAANASVEISAQAAAKVKKSVTIPVGKFPFVAMGIPGSAKLDIEVGLEGSVEGKMNVSYSKSETIKAGASYDKSRAKKWKPIWEKTRSEEAKATGEVNAKVRAYLKPKLTFTLAGVTAPSIYGKGYVEAALKIDPLRVTIGLYAGLEFGIGGNVKVFGFSVATLDDMVIWSDGPWTIWEKTINRPGIPITLSPPTSLTASQSGADAGLSWQDKSNNEDGFKILRRKSTESSYSTLAKTAASTTTYTATGLTPGAKYFFKVVAYRGKTDSAASNEVSITIPSAPAAPTGLAAKVLQSQMKVSLTWRDNSTSEEGFKVMRSTDGASFSTVADKDAGTQSHIDTVRSAGTYWYRIDAYNDSGTTSSSVVSIAITDTLAQNDMGTGGDAGNNTSSPTTIAVPSSGSGIVTRVSDREDFYRIALTAGMVATIVVTPQGGADVDLELYSSSSVRTPVKSSQKSAGVAETILYRCNTTGDFFVRVYASGKNDPTQMDYLLSVSAATVPNAPSSLVATPAVNQIALAWTDESTDESGFKLWRRIGENAWQQIVTPAANATTYTDVTGALTDECYYKVQSSNSVGDSEFSNEIVVQPIALPDLTIAISNTGSYTSGQAGVQVTLTVTRTGGNLTSGTRVSTRLSLSADSTLDAADTLLWESDNTGQTIPLADLNTAGSKAITATFVIPQSLTTGTYALIAVVDPGNIHAEGDEGNNSSVASVAITAQTPSAVVNSVKGGGWHSMALMSDGTVRAWGWNNEGQLGDGTNIDRLVPTKVSGLTGISALAAGDSHSLALKNDGTVWTWGANGAGQLGNGTTTGKNQPTQIASLTGVTAISGGGYHSLAVKSDGTVWVWGWNWHGQLGNGTNTDSAVPVQVSGLIGVVAVSGGGAHSLALKSDGTVWTWGYGGDGELGNGAFADSNVPVQVSGLTGVTAIAGGWFHSVALKNDGTVRTWGLNIDGQLGNGSPLDSNTPVQALGLTNITAIGEGGGGGFHSVARKNDGSVWAWGYNGYGQLGDGTLISRDIPIQVPGITAANVSSGGYHSLAGSLTSTTYLWGFNYDGEIGDGTKGVNRASPVTIVPQ